MGKYNVNGNIFTSDEELRQACQNDSNFRISAYGHDRNVPAIRLIELLDAMGYKTEILEQ